MNCPSCGTEMMWLRTESKWRSEADSRRTFYYAVQTCDCGRVEFGGEVKAIDRFHLDPPMQRTMRSKKLIAQVELYGAKVTRGDSRVEVAFPGGIAFTYKVGRDGAVTKIRPHGLRHPINWVGDYVRGACTNVVTHRPLGEQLLVGPDARWRPYLRLYKWVNPEIKLVWSSHDAEPVGLALAVRRKEAEPGEVLDWLKDKQLINW